MASTDDGEPIDDAASGLSADAMNRRYLRLLDHSPDPLCVHSEGVVVYVNPAAVRNVAARVAGELLGRMITDFVHPASIPGMLGRLADLRHEGDSSEPAEAVMVRLDGSLVDAEIVSVLTCWDGKPAYQVIFRDLTTIKAARATIRRQAALVAHATEAIIGTTTEGVVDNWNQAAEFIYHRPAAQALGLPIHQALGAPTDLAAITAAGGVAHLTHHTADGDALDVRIAVAATDDGHVLVCSNLTALRHAERRLQTVVDTVDVGIVVLNAHGDPEVINPAALRILDLTAELPARKSGGNSSFRLTLIGPSGQPLGDARRLAEHLLSAGGTLEQVTVGYDRPDGQRRWLSVDGRLLDAVDTGPPALLMSFTDVTDRHNIYVHLNHQAHHDALTGLPNRASTELRAHQALLEHAPPALAAVLFIDLDGVKTVNDRFGHGAGDEVIITAAHRLRAALREEDHLARHGGDEFVALLFGSSDRAEVELLADRLHEALAAPLLLAGFAHRITASIGITSVRPNDTRNAVQLLTDADAAMYTAKIHRASTHIDS